MQGTGMSTEARGDFCACSAPLCSTFWACVHFGLPGTDPFQLMGGGVDLGLVVGVGSFGLHGDVVAFELAVQGGAADAQHFSS
jgi:hypothetical protein